MKLLLRGLQRVSTLTGVFLFLLLQLFLPRTLVAQSYQVLLSPSLDSLQLGQAFHIGIQLSEPLTLSLDEDDASAQVEGLKQEGLNSSLDANSVDFQPWPKALRELKPVEFVAGSGQKTLVYTLAAFELGSIVIEWPELVAQDQRFLPSQPRSSLYVRSSFQADSLVAPAGIFAPMMVEHSLSWWVKRVLGLLLLVLLLLALWKLWKRPARKHEALAPPPLPPWDRFLKALVRLGSARYLEMGLQDEYYSGLSLALRGYLEDETGSDSWAEAGRA